MTTQLDGEFGLLYQLRVMKEMIEQLPPRVQVPFLKQLDSIVVASDNREKLLREMIVEQLSDVELAIKALDFDLVATRQERDHYKSLLDN